MADRNSRAEGKTLWSLLPYDALEVLAQHYTRGALKYSARNWEKGMPYSEMVDSLMRHLSAWFQGEDIDPEGFNHLTAVVWNAIGLQTYVLRGMHQFDDRPNSPDKVNVPQDWMRHNDARDFIRRMEGITKDEKAQLLSKFSATHPGSFTGTESDLQNWVVAELMKLDDVREFTPNG